ncbi:MAG TPA: hypothetical protein VE955_11660, partial [Candidatus Dormibacteraeota bacterium]|nr:hypothetical protein [Candidatus Dormibacteraeota bacterium]
MDITQAASLRGISLGPVIWSERFNNASTWTASGSGSGSLTVNKTVSLKIIFSSSTTSQAINVYHNVSISLDQDPILTVSLQVSPGVSYGVRFWGVTADHRSFAAWHEGSPLQHRPGLGVRETLSAGLLTEASIPNPTLSLAGARITGVGFYVEAVPLVTGTFSLFVYNLHTNSA